MTRSENTIEAGARTQADKLNQFAALLEAQTIATLRAEGLGCEANIQNARVTVVAGRKFIKVDVGSSGKYMVDAQTEEIFGIKGYGVVHRGHRFGTLDTIEDFNWGGYRAVRGPFLREFTIEPAERIIPKDVRKQDAPKFKVGDGASWTLYTDTHAGFIIEVSANGETVKWQAATATLLNGANSDAADKLEFSPGGFVGHTSGIQRYDIKPNPAGEIQTFTLRDNGRWVLAGHGAKQRGNSLSPGLREHYDYNF